MLFSDNYVLTETYGPGLIKYEYEDGFIFTSRDDEFVYSNQMYIDRDQIEHTMNKSAGFAIESYRRGPNFNPDDETCVKNSNLELQRFIYDCRGNITVRNLTKAEAGQMQQYKDQQKGKFSALKQINGKSNNKRQFFCKQ